jgi:catechol 2,3-dioxygenase-like lactoylglutathione lyase family enzyme
MAIDHLNHINLRARDIHETRDFYRDVLGLKEGIRPNFASFGYWMYAGDSAVVHISHCEPESARRTDPEGMGHGLDHFALWAQDLDAQLGVLDQRGIEYDKRLAWNDTMVQLFFKDPNGVIVELGYDAAKEGVTRENFEKVPA